MRDAAARPHGSGIAESVAEDRIMMAMRLRAGDWISLAACALAWCASARADGAVRLTVEGAYWRASPSGTTTVTEGGRAGSGGEIDLSDDLDLGSGDLGEGEIALSYARHRFSLAYQPLDFGGSTTIGRDLVFHGATFPAGGRVRSDVGLRFVIPRYDYGLLDGPAGAFRAGLEAYVWTFDARLRESSPGPVLDEERRFTHVLPAVTLQGTVPLGLGGLALGADGAFGVIGAGRYAVDLRPRVEKTLWDRCRVAVGYRWLRFAFRETTNRGDLTAQGPFVSVAIDVLPAAGAAGR
jgi:hypothetical protein